MINEPQGLGCLFGDEGTPTKSPPKSLFFDDEDVVESKYNEFIPRLPPQIENKALLNDMRTMFEPRERYKDNFPDKTVPIEKQVTKMKKFEKICNEKGYSKNTRDSIKPTYEFLKNFPKTPLFKQLLKNFNYDSEKAFNFFAKMFRARILTGGESPETAMSNIMKHNKEMKDLAKSLQEVMGKRAGNGQDLTQEDMYYLERAEEIRKYLPYLNIKYKSASKKNTKMEESFLPADEIEPRNIRTYDEQILPQELIAEDDIFYQKMARKDMKTLQHYEIKHEAKKYCMLLDISGSMSDGDRIPYSCASGISLADNALKGANEIDIIPFGSTPCDTAHFEDVEDAKKFFLKTPFSGGGTDIDLALRKMDQGNYDECILITDGRDTVNYVPKTPVFTVFCGDDPYGENNLATISSGYEEYQRINVS